ncbi:MAG: lytic murein transglycosylase [Gammaproteobacteria bacterium]|nr:lytic murein transglycosylase [Gammaproteobacteria bacterium]
MTTRALILTLLIFGSPLASAQGRLFSECIADWQRQGRSAGLSASTVDKVIPSLRHLPDIIRYDRAQPEFTQTLAQYLDKRVTPARIDRGQALLEQYSDFLAELTKQHGVPGRYLIAFWGLETNFGRHLGKMPTLSSLATLACDPRRSAYFTDELFTALSLMERESFTPAQMRGSWAGAMGHTQFMPSAYQQYSIDGDDDGRIDLWHSKRDALASGANFLKHLGWHAEQLWGREVRLPDDFPYAESGLSNRQPVSYWRSLGVTKTNRSPLPDIERRASILVPAGHTGPAFLVYPNFDVIMKWNRSESYAIAVGLLADQIAGLGPLSRPPSLAERPLSLPALKQIQSRLNSLGFDAGEPDGVMGPNTRAALSAFQTSSGLIADGYPDPATRKALADRFKSISAGLQTSPDPSHFQQ